MTGIYFICMLIVSIWAFGLAVFATQRLRMSRLAVPFFWMMVFFALWSMTYYAESTHLDPGLRYLMVLMRPFFVFGMGFSGLIMAVRLGGWERYLSFRLILAMAVIPAGIALAVMTQRYHEFFQYNFHIARIDGVSRVMYERGPLYAVYMAYTELLGFIYIAMLVTVLVTRREKRIAIPLVMLAFLAPGIVDIMYGYGATPVRGVNLTAYLYLILEAGIVFIIFRYKFLTDELVPIGRDVALDSMSDIMLILDERNRIVDMNRTARNEFGLENKAVGSPAKEVLNWWPEVAGCFGQDEPVREKIELDIGCSRRVYNVSVSPIIAGDSHAFGRLAVFHDITGEERIRKSLEENTLQLARANAAKDDFLANISHEVRTPMTAIIGFSEILGEIATTEEQREYIEGIRGSADAMSGILNDVLDLSKIESGHLQIRNTVFDLRKTAEVSLSLVSRRAAGKDIALSLEYDDRIPSGLIGDELRIEQIMLNLLSNAVKFTEKGRVTLKVSGARKWSGGPIVAIEVEDTGAGINGEDIARIFDKFFRIEDKNAGRVEGTGLGLAITKRLVQMMDGVIDVASRPGEGSVFRVELPLAAADGPVAEEPPAPVSVDAILKPGVQVLFVDDTETNIMIGRRFLEILGCGVDVARNGIEAVEMTAERHYDAVLMDHRMPLLSGLDAAQRIREREARTGGRSVIIGISASAMAQDREQCIEAGMDDFMPKPFTLAKMEALLLKHFAEKTPGNGGAAHAAKPAAPVEPREHAVFDAEAALGFAGSREFLDEIISVYISVIPETMVELAAAIDDGEPKKIELAAHKLKGMFAQMGAWRARDAAATLEESAFDVHAAKDLIKKLVEETDALNTEVVRRKNAADR